MSKIRNCEKNSDPVRLTNTTLVKSRTGSVCSGFFVKKKKIIKARKVIGRLVHAFAKRMQHYFFGKPNGLDQANLEKLSKEKTKHFFGFVRALSRVVDE